MSGTYSENKILTNENVRENGIPRLSSLIQLCLDVATDQNKKVGITYPVLKGLGVTWIVTQYYVNINSLPVINSLLTISTKVTGYNKYFSYKDFYVLDVDGKELIRVHSTWVLMSLKTRKIVPMVPELLEKYHVLHKSSDWKFPRIGLIDKNRSKNRQYKIDESQIDFNGHAHNTNYFNWLVDSLPSQFRNLKLKSVNLRYVKEVKLNDLINIYSEIGTDQTGIYSKHEIANHGHISAKAECRWY